MIQCQLLFPGSKRNDPLLKEQQVPAVEGIWVWDGGWGMGERESGNVASRLCFSIVGSRTLGNSTRISGPHIPPVGGIRVGLH